MGFREPWKGLKTYYVGQIWPLRRHACSSELCEKLSTHFVCAKKCCSSWELNPGPSHYRMEAFPTELSGQLRIQCLQYATFFWSAMIWVQPSGWWHLQTHNMLSLGLSSASEVGNCLRYHPAPSKVPLGRLATSKTYWSAGGSVSVTRFLLLLAHCTLDIFINFYRA